MTVKKIEITSRTIIRTIVLLILAWVLYLIRDFILLLFIGIISASALAPVVRKLEKFKVPRFLSILVFYLIFIGLLAGAIASIIPIVVEQVTTFINNLPMMFEQIEFLNMDFRIGDYISEISRIPGNIFKIINLAVSNILRIAALVVIIFYLLVERKGMENHLKYFFDDGDEDKAIRIVQKFENRLGGWVRGQITLMFIVGLLVWIGLKLLAIEFALPLAIIAGILEIVPNIGPTLSMLPALLVAASYSPPMVLAVFALYFLVQQLENNIIVPFIMKKVIGFHPLVTLIALMVGFKLGGIGGTLLSLPILLTGQIIAEEFHPHLFSDDDEE